MYVAWETPKLTGFFYTLGGANGPMGCSKGSRLLAGVQVCSDPHCATAKGLRPGDLARRVGELYPGVRRERKGSYEHAWLITAFDGISGSDAPVLAATIQGGKVVALQLALGLGGD